MLKQIVSAAALVALFAGASSFAADTGYVPDRKELQRSEVPGSNYVAVMAVTTIDPGKVVARHTHPGVEISYVLEGEGDFVIEGKKNHVKAGGSFRLEPKVRHSVLNGPSTMKILAVYIIPKGEPVATPAPE